MNFGQLERLQTVLDQTDEKALRVEQQEQDAIAVSDAVQGA